MRVRNKFIMSLIFWHWNCFEAWVTPISYHRHAVQSKSILPALLDPSSSSVDIITSSVVSSMQIIIARGTKQADVKAGMMKKIQIRR